MQKCRVSHTAVLPCGYTQRSWWRRRLVSHHFFDNVLVVNKSDLSLLLAPVGLLISFIFSAFAFAFGIHFCMSTASFISGIAFLSPFIFRPFFGVSRGLVPGDDATASVSSGLRSGDPCSLIMPKNA